MRIHYPEVARLKKLSIFSFSIKKSVETYQVLQGMKNSLSWFGWAVPDSTISMFIPFHPRLIYLRLGSFQIWFVFRISYFGVVFDLVYQTCKNFHTYIFRKEEFLYVPISMYLSCCFVIVTTRGPLTRIDLMWYKMI